MDISSKLDLPQMKTAPVRSEVDFYGLSSIIAEQLKLKKVPWSYATWRHGWLHTPLKHVGQLQWQDTDLPWHLVTSENDVLFLKKAGISNVVAAGLPFIYADITSVKRHPKSLLVMPPHSLKSDKIAIDESRYVDYIMGISDKFDHIVFCLHHECAENGSWFQTLEAAGIDWVIGASEVDMNSLVRMQKIFRSFEYMTTCTVGSHLVYAAYCGCKVSISGKFFEYDLDCYRNTPYYKMFPEVLELNLTYYTESAIRDLFPFFFVDPFNAELQVEWAENEVGAKHKKNLEDLRVLLGWDIKGQIKARLRYAKKKIMNRLFRVYSQ